MLDLFHNFERVTIERVIAHEGDRATRSRRSWPSRVPFLSRGGRGWHPSTDCAPTSCEDRAADHLRSQPASADGGHAEG